MLLKYLRGRDWLMIVVCLVLIAGQAYLDLLIPEYMGVITNHLQEGTATDIIVRDGVSMLACALLSLVLAMCATVLSARVSSSFCHTLRSKLFENVSSFSKQDIDQFSAASLITRSTNDIYQIQQFLPRALSSIVKAPMITVLAVWKIAGSSYQWTSVTVVTVVIMLIAFTLILYQGMPYMRKLPTLIDDVNQITREDLIGARTIRSYNAEGIMETKLNEASKRLLDNSVTLVRVMSPMHALASSMMNYLTLAIYWVGAGLIQSTSSQGNQMSLFSDMIVFTSYATQIISAVMLASNVLRGLPRVMVSVKRIDEAINYSPSIADPDLPCSPNAVGSVEFRNVSFRYPGTDVDVLTSVSFTVNPGETVAIVGQTASGKSTLLSLVSRLYDVCEGSILVDGVDVRRMDLEDLNSRLGYVPQTAVVFSGTIRENVAYGKSSSGLSDAEIIRALKVSQLSDFVESTPDGLDTVLVQHGWNLSGGQKQRLSIARAVCKSPVVYLLDDIFSALDYRTECNLRRALENETSGVTKIIVTQRVGTVTDADRIVVLDRGRVVGTGRHCELLETCPLYREIANSQTEGPRCHPGTYPDGPRRISQGTCGLRCLPYLSIWAGTGDQSMLE